MRKEEAKDRRDRQGKIREYCLDDLLETLLEGPLGLNGILEKINEEKFAGNITEPTYSKGTVIKNLRRAVGVEEGLAEYVPDKRKGVGDKRRPIRLTAKGRKRAERNRITNAICVLSDDDFKRFIMNYKVLLVREFIDYFDDRAIGAGFFNSPYHAENDKELEKIMNQKVIDAENDLRLHGFKEDEIVKMWLINRGELVLRVLEKFSGPTFFSRGKNIPKEEHNDKEKAFIAKIKKDLLPHLR
jgi:hypothetical protein